MAFGRLVTKWRIIHTNLNHSLKKNALIIQVAARLHNFVIDSDRIQYTRASSGLDLANFGVEPMPADKFPRGSRGFLPSVPKNDGETAEAINTGRRDWIIEEIRDRGLLQPDFNLFQNADDG